jgi:potassium efflux system protein
LTFTIALTEKRMQLGESNFRRGWLLAMDYVREAFENMQTVFVASLFEVNETPVTLLGLLRVIIIVMIAWGISRGACSAIKHLSENRSSVSQSSIYALTRVIHYVILSLGVVIGLSSIGVDFTKFALLASALSIGIGFGLQTLVSNFVACLIILFEKSMKVGDFVELESGITGEVQVINMRSTLITTTAGLAGQFR